jgi:hypothetical protein
MNILQGKCISMAFFSMKTDRNLLNNTDIVNCGILLKISFGYKLLLRVEFKRDYRRRYLLYQSQPGFSVLRSIL